MRAYPIDVLGLAPIACRRPGAIPGVVANLTAGYADPADSENPLLSSTTTANDPLILDFDASSGASSYEARISRDGVTIAVVPLDLAGEVVSQLPFGTAHDIAVRGVGARGRKGPWSADVEITTFAPKLEYLRGDTATYVGIGTSYTGFDLDNMTGGALTRAVGNWLIVGTHGPGGSANASEVELPEGWTAFGFIGISGAAVRVAMKEVDGSEGVVQLLSTGSGSNVRFNSWAAVLDADALEVGDFIATFAEATGGNPAALTLTTAFNREPIFVFSASSGTTSLPDQVFTTSIPTAGTTVTPDATLTEEQSTTVQQRTTVKFKTYGAQAERGDLTSNPADNGNNSHAFGGVVATIESPQVDVRIQARIRQVSAVGIIWNGGADATVAEGTDIDSFIEIDPNGTTRTGSVSVEFRVVQGAEYTALAATEGWSEANATRANGSFPYGFTNLIEAAADLAGIGYAFIGDGWCRLTFPVGTDRLDWSRPTTDDPTQQGDKRVAYELINPSAGTIGDGIVSTVITDETETPPVAGAPSSVSLTFGADSVALGAAAGTVIGQIRAYDTEGAELTITAADFQSDGDEGGRFDITGTGPFNLVVGATSPDFIDDAVLSKPAMFYFPAVTVTTAGGTLNGTLRVRPKYAEVNPTGHGAGSTTTITSISQLNTLLGQTGNGVKLKISESWTGVNQGTGNAQLKRSNVTYEGHPRWAINHGRGWVFKQGSNIIVKDWAFRVGYHTALNAFQTGGSETLREVDNLMVSYKGVADIDGIIFQNCSFATSNDEAARVKGGGQNTGQRYYARNVRFSRCLFGEPLYAAYHPKGDRHNLGPAVSPKNVNTVFDKCLLIGPSNRMPMMNRCVGASVINCVVAHWQQTLSRGGSQCNQGEVGAGNEILTIRIEGCLYDHPTAVNAINLQFLDNVDTAYVYAPTTGTYANHWISQASDTFTDDPLAVGDGINLNEGSLEGVLRTTPPFDRASDYDIMPTSTEAERRAVFADVLDYVGVRLRDGQGNLIPGDDAATAYDHDVISAYRTTGLQRNQDITPAEMDALYGTDGTAGDGTYHWNGGGSLGYGMADITTD